MALHITRRGFIEGVGLLAAGAAVFTTGCGSTSTQSQNAASDTTTSSDAALSVGDLTTSATTDSDVLSYYSHVKSVVSLAQTFPAGEKVVGVALEYDTEVDGSSIEVGGGGVGQQAQQKGLGTFYVLGRTISNVYANDNAALDTSGGKTSGNFVIIELDSTDAGAQTMVFQMSRGQVGSNGPVCLDSGAVKVCQIGDLSSTSGETLSGDSSMTRYLVASSVSNADVDVFSQGTFDDEETGCHATFALREPDGYDASQSYPLTLFLPDAGVTTCEVKVNLRQGLGAVSWVDEPQFVLTVAGTCADIPTCLDLIDALVAEGYSIDTDRLYGTGESAGCMALIAYAAEHPDDCRFAALMFVAGQGNMTPISKTPFIAFVSEDDESSYGGMSDAETGISSIGIDYVETQLDCTYNFDGEGHTSGRWVDYAATGESNPSGNQEGAKAADSTRTLEELMSDLSTAASDAIAQADDRGAHALFFHIAQGTLDGTDSSIEGGNTHNFTWQYAYNIPELREWILEQSL